MPPETVIEISQDAEEHHARKRRHVRNSQKDGIALYKRDGYTAYLEYSKPYAAEYFPAVDGGPEQIQCRSGDSSFTVHGRHLWPLFEDLLVKFCDAIGESPHPHLADTGGTVIELITVRLFA